MMVAITDGNISMANFETNFSMLATPARVLMAEL
jgi:hypothetical protein